VIDLGAYVTSFSYEINPPGQTLIDLSETEAVGRLSDSFWECRMAGFLPFAPYTCDDQGIISPFSESQPDLDREMIQIIILFAGYRCLITTMQNVATSTTYKAGSVESSVSRSTSMYVAALKAVTSKIDIALTRLSDLGSTSVAVLDSVIDSTIAIAEGEAWFVSAGNDYPSSSWEGY
jgi:hypothetical protein